MKNLKAFDGNSFEFYQQAYSRKKDESLVSRLKAIDDDLKTLYSNYENGFQTNTLEGLSAQKFEEQSREDLLSLYAYDCKAMQDLRTSLIANGGKRNVKCQNCTINNISSFDHILPKNEFPEFTIHPKNLMCCCNDCNSRRSSIWRQEGKRTTLNLYTDKLPDTQYLFVKITYNDHELDTNFYLDPKNGIEKKLFALLLQHYDRLDLYRRFSDSADTVITSFRSLLSSMPLNKETIENVINPFLEKEQVSFGYNYWQAILKLELLKNEQFMFELGYTLP